MAPTPESPDDQEEPGGHHRAGHHRADRGQDAEASSQKHGPEPEDGNVGPGPEVEANAPDSPTGMPKRSWGRC